MLKIDLSRGPDMLLSDIHGYIAATEKRIATNDEVDLAGLDVAVDTLCKRVLAMGESDAKPYAAELTKLMDTIEAMQAKMITMQGEVAKAITSLDTQKKAAKAYINAPKVEK